MIASPFTPSRRAFMAGSFGLGLAAALSLPASASELGPVITDGDAFVHQQDGKMIIVDIRTPTEWSMTGIAQDALTIDMQDPDFVKKLVQLRLDNPDKEIGLICASSNRSGQAQTALSQAGFDRVYSIFGGMTGNDQAKGWIADGLPTTGCC